MDMRHSPEKSDWCYNKNAGLIRPAFLHLNIKFNALGQW